jgi:branched-chain amino acid transport system ATP-binding protein
MTALLEVVKATKLFGAVRSLSEVTFSVGEREILGVIGPNGAGKSTLINVLTGVYAPSSGMVRFAGQDISNLPTAERARLGLVRTFQRPSPIADLSCAEGVMVGGLVRGMSISEARRQATAKLRLLGLEKIAERSPRTLPTGHLKLLDLARVLMLAPKLVLLDELMAGLSLVELDIVLRAIETLAEEGTSFVVIEHLMEVIKRLSHRLIVMDAGQIVATGAPATVIRDPQVVLAYLGEEAQLDGDA